MKAKTGKPGRPGRADAVPTQGTPPPRFQEIQRRFSDHLRNPDHHPPPPGIEDRRLAIYRNAVYGNMNEFMGDNFPRIQECLGAHAWARLIRDYLARHRSHTPVFPELAGEFLHYLALERQAPEDPPFLYELAHYDWLESEINIDPTEIDLTGIDREGDPLEGILILNPVHRLITFQYPVHRIGPDYQPTEPPPQPTFLLVYRNLAQREGFIELNAVAARLFELARAADAIPCAAPPGPTTTVPNGNVPAARPPIPGDAPISPGPPRNGSELLLQIAAELRHPKPEVVIAGGREILSRWRERDVLLGTRPLPAPPDPFPPLPGPPSTLV